MTQQELVLPKGWVETTVKNICDVSAGIGFPIIHQGQTQGKYPLYKVGDISKSVQKGEIWLTKANNYVSDDVCKILKGKPFPKGTIVFAKIGEALKLNRRAITSDFSLFDNNVMGLIPIQELIENKYLFYFFNTIKLEKIARATTVPSIRKDDVESIKFPLSPLNEQKRIVSKIEELFSKIDSTKKLLEHTKLQLVLYKQSILKSVFSKFEKKPLSDIAKVISGFSFKSKDFTDDGILVVKISNIGYGEFVEKNQEFLPMHYLKQCDDFVVHPKTILIALTRPITNNTLKICEYPENHPTGLLNQRVAKIELSENFEKKILLFYFQAFDFKQQIMQSMTGTEQPNLSPLKLADFLIPLPPLEEQEQIVSQLEQGFSLIENSQRIVNSTLQTLETMRMSVLKQAFEGKLVPQDPNDEPASILLENIKKAQVDLKPKQRRAKNVK